jgi:hypothetical protein
VTGTAGLATLLLLVLVSVADINASLVWRIVRVRANLLGIALPQVRQGPLPFLRLFSANPLARPLPPQVVRNQSLLRTLEELSSWPREKKRVSLVYIPRRYRSLWEISPFPDIGLSFLVPAISGMGMIDGLPDLAKAGSEIQNSYGFPAYGPVKPRSSSPADENLERAEALRRAAAMGFRRVVLLDADPDGRLSVKEVALPEARL